MTRRVVPAEPDGENYIKNVAEPERMRLAAAEMVLEGRTVRIIPGSDVVLGAAITGVDTASPAIFMIAGEAGISYVVSTDELRGFASSMVQLADRFEARAAAEAEAALAKARGK